MDTTQDSLQAEVSTPEVQDEFASGPPNRLRSGVLHLVGWLFGPPYFPTGLTWLLMALIATNSAIELLVQPASYWVDFSTSEYYTFLGTQLAWGLGAIGAYIGYMIIAALILSIINIKPAFALWTGLSVYHFTTLTESFHCRALYFFPFENPDNCTNIHTVSVVFAGVLWGVLLTATVRQGLISRIALVTTETDPPRARMGNLRNVSIGWITLLSLAVLLTAVLSPKPAWHILQTAHVPPGRTEAALVYDTKRSVAVLFGGTPSWTQAGGWQSINDTWEWNGSDWTKLQPLHSPLPRYAAAMAFDERRGVTVLFGGMGRGQDDQSVIYGDTWEWDGQDWQEISPSISPPAREDTSAYFDPLRGTVVMYGGHTLEQGTAANVYLDDAWEWDGKDWQQITFDEPRRNSASAIVFDPIRQLPMLMDVEGLWLWQEPLWTPASFAAGPPGRWSSQMVYNPDNQQIVLFAGFKDTDVFNDTWSYDGQTWQQVFTKVQPPRRHGHNLFYDPILGRVLLFGGLDGGTFYSDMWELVQP